MFLIRSSYISNKAFCFTFFSGWKYPSSIFFIFPLFHSLHLPVQLVLNAFIDIFSVYTGQIYNLLDHNLHLNNTHYASFILDSIEGIEKKKITDLQINYLNECHFKQKVSTYYKKHDDSNKIIIEGIRDDGVISFIGLVTLENI